LSRSKYSEEQNSVFAAYSYSSSPSNKKRIFYFLSKIYFFISSILSVSVGPSLLLY